jgi:lipoprotein-anchoring transpeptidase ErfK/SrfK/peptidoglycan hydrolase-like protein with peptidoglycan-binding domain
VALSCDRNHAEILRSGPTAWNAWRKQNPTTVPELAGIALKLAEHRLGSRNGEPINLKSARLQDAILRFATLVAADLEAADMTRADLAHGRFNLANLSAAILSRARLDYADFAGANLSKVNLRGASLRFATLSAADLQAARLSGADLAYARFDHANLGAADLSGARLDYADFAGANLKKTNLRGASLHHAKNLTREQLEQSEGSASTILPPHLQESVSWSVAKRQTRSTALERYDPRPRPQPTTKLDVPTRGTYKQRIWVSGALFLGALVTIGIVWKHIDEAVLVTASIEQRGSEQSLPRASLQDTIPDLLVEALKPSVLVSAAPAVPQPQLATVSAPDLLAEASEPSPHVSAAPLALRDATVAIFVLRSETSMISRLVAIKSPLSASLPRTEASEASPVSPVSVSHPGKAPDLRTEDSPLLTPAAEASVELLASSPPDSSALRDTSRLPVVAASTRLVFAVAVAPTEFKRSREEPSEKSTGANREPLMLVVSLSDQNVDIYRGSTRITSSRVSTGMPGYATKAGVFSILEKQRSHHSNLYDDAPMPWMQRLTRSGTALHAGVVPGYPASHGCIRLPFSFAPKLFQITTVGEIVVVARDRLSPKLIEHPNLFQPLPLRATAEEKQASRRRLSDVQDVPVESPVPHLILANQGGGGEANGSGDHAATDGSGSGNNGDAVVASASTAPLRILVTRQTQLDRIIGVQYMLSSLGYLTPQNFTGRLGTATADAIKAFQKANSMPETGLLTDDLAKKVYAVAGKEEPPEGHLFVRQDFNRVFDAPVAFRNPKLSLGTHVFTAMEFAPGDTKIQWLALSLEGGDSASALDRIKIPDDIRQKISERLTPGSSLIVADTSVDSAILPEGDDFLVWAEDAPTKAEKPEAAKQANAEIAKAKKAKVKRPQARPPATKPRIAQKAWNERSWERAAPRYSYERSRGFGRFGLFSPW